MDFAPSAKAQDFAQRLTAFMEEHVYPAEKVYHDQHVQHGDRWAVPPIIEELKEKARSAGLWNLFLPDERFGAGLCVLEYAPLAEITGRCQIAPEVFNCAAPDSGNMETLSLYGTPEQQDQWLRPLLDGKIRSAFLMTEPRRRLELTPRISNAKSDATATTMLSTDASGGLRVRAIRAARSSSSWARPTPMPQLTHNKAWCLFPPIRPA